MKALSSSRPRCIHCRRISHLWLLLCLPRLWATIPDDFVSRQDLLNPVAFSNLFTTATATREPFEPLHAQVNSSNSIWLSWEAPSAGGVVLEAVSEAGFAAPILAVYVGTNVSSLTSVAHNHAPVWSNQVPLNMARVVFTAQPGQRYQIAIDGRPTPGFTSEGAVSFTLILLPPPPNDHFLAAIPFPGSCDEALGASFRGSSQEPLEPPHGPSGYEQTLWWRWTAPTNLNVGVVPVRFTAEMTSDGRAPDIRTYIGSTLGSLTPVTVTQAAWRNTRSLRFLAAAGTTYHFAVAGVQNDTNSVLPLVGDLRVRLTTPALMLRVQNLTAVTNQQTQTISLDADLRIENLGSAPLDRMRITLQACPGLVLQGAEPRSIISAPIPLSNYPVPGSLAPNQAVVVPVTGATPVPVFVDPLATEPFRVFGLLEHELVPGAWRILDSLPVIDGEGWTLVPTVGGGVITLTPGCIDCGAFDPLASVRILGPDPVAEGSSSQYYGEARFASGLVVLFTNTVWLSAVPSITNGLFTPGILDSNTDNRITAMYDSSGFLHEIGTNVIVLNLPPPSLSAVSAGTALFWVMVNGVSNRMHVIEATTNLVPPLSWEAVATNALGEDGRGTFEIAVGAIPERYFRAREAQ